ncbi:MAG: hypothetical protein QXD94_05475 [Sulfolobales archaeon]
MECSEEGPVYGRGDFIVLKGLGVVGCIKVRYGSRIRIGAMKSRDTLQPR